MSMPGKGKTTFGSSIPGALHLDFEDSAGFVENPKAYRVAIKSPDQLLDVMKALTAQAGKPDNPIKHIVWDTVEESLGIVIPLVTKLHNAKVKNAVSDIREFGKDGAGWGKINDWVQTALRDLYNVGYGWTVCGHLKEVNVIDPGTHNTITAYRPLINDGIKGGVTRLAQFIGQIYSEDYFEDIPKQTEGGFKLTEKVRKTRWYLDLTSPDTTEAMTRYVKTRLGKYMAQRIDITGPNGWDQLAGAYNDARQKAGETDE